jgi:hypothetical protein
VCRFVKRAGKNDQSNHDPGNPAGNMLRIPERAMLNSNEVILEVISDKFAFTNLQSTDKEIPS